MFGSAWHIALFVYIIVNGLSEIWSLTENGEKMLLGF